MSVKRRKIPQGDRRGIGIAPVHDHLELCNPARCDRFGKINRYRDRDPRLSCIQVGVYLALVFSGTDDREVARSRQFGRKFPAHAAPVGIVDDRREIVDVKGNGIPEDEQKQYRHEECHGQAQRITPDLDDLFFCDRFDAKKFHVKTQGKPGARSQESEYQDCAVRPSPDP